MKEETPINSRILYTEPNYINYNGVDLAVKQEDLCIYVDLIVETKTRFQTQANAANSTYVLSWSGSYNEGENSASFLGGRNLNSKATQSFLTTYYTDINYDTTKKGTVVEGLGITDINIEFDSWYLPQITIKFSDVRGSSLFVPNEYSSFDSGSDPISNGFYKSFFTFPYPQFTLKVKGFYGKPAVYLLNCVDFKSEFNSSTGNFDSTASFVGFTYAFLADIQLQYLVAAPYDTYFGQQYWEGRLNSDEWALEGGGIMPTLRELQKDIANGMAVLQQLSEKDKNVKKKYEIKDRIDSLVKINSSIKSFIDNFKSQENVRTFKQDSEYVFMLTPNSNNNVYILTDDLKNLYNNIIVNIADFNNKDYGTRLPYPNHISETLENNNFFITKILEDNKIASSVDGDANSILTSTILNDNMKMGESVAKTIIKSVEAGSNLPQYCYIYKLFSLETDTANLLDKLRNEERDLQRLINDYVKEVTTSVLKFNPNIYNITKIIFAHLETFIASLYNCATNVSGRTFNDLSIDVDNSDVMVMSSNNVLPAFPGIKGEGKNGIFVDSWIGDFAKDGEIPEEANLIYGYTRASNSVAQDIKTIRNELNNATVNKDFIPTIPFDVAMNQNPFKFVNINGETLGNFISQLGLRMVKVLGVTFDTEELNSNFATDAGKADAINYWAIRQNYKEKVSLILSTLGVVDGSGSDNASEMIIDYLQSKNSNLNQETKNGEYIYDFELIEGEDGKNPMLIEEGNNLVYNLIEVGDMKIIPSTPKLFTTTPPCYSDDYTDTASLFKLPSNLTHENEYFYSLEDNFAIANGWENNYVNSSVFEIIDSGSNRYEKTMVQYESIKKGNIEIENIKKSFTLSNLIDKIWNVETKDFLVFYFHGNNEEKLKKQSLLPLNFKTDEEIEEGIKNKEDNTFLTSSHIYFTDPDEYNKNVPITKIKEDGNIDDFTVKEFLTNGDGENVSFFGSPFYYMQNKLPYENDIKTKIKATLFLQTVYSDFHYDTLGNVNTLSFIKDKHASIIKIPSFHLLTLGAFLWRRKFCIKNNIDDCYVYEEIDNEIGKISYMKPKFESVKPYDLTLFYNNDRLPIYIAKTNTQHKTFLALALNTFMYGNNIDLMRIPIQNKLINYFEKWAMNESNGFAYIMNQYELRNLNNGVISVFSGGEFYKKVKEYSKVKDNSEDYSNLKFLRDNFDNNVLKNYAMLSVKGEGLLLINREKTNANNIYKKLLINDSLIVYSGFKNLKTNSGEDIKFKTSLGKAYVSEFIKTLSQLTSENNISGEKNPTTTPPSDIVNYRDLNISMYNYLKKIYDSWFIGKRSEDFNVKTFFEEQFIFIDSFYNKVGNDIIVDCEYFREKFENTVDSSNLYSFLADIYAKCGMLFVAMPNFNDWTTPESVNNIFKPIPYTSMPPDDNKNNFVCMYVHEPSKNLDINGSENGSYGFSKDGFDIHDPNKSDTETLAPMPTFTQYDLNNSLQIPSFGVAFAKQNQSYFKNVKVGMNSPVTTEYSIKAVYQIAQNGGNNGEGKGTYWGQDLYTVWSNYSYTCEVEMMGCAQIQPLMYFQLLNIPLFRGTYIVTKVSHSIKAGYMTTNFVGTKLCKYGKPFISQAFGLLGVLVKEGYNYSNKLETTTIVGSDGISSTSNNTIKLLKNKYTFHNPDNYNVSDYDNCPKCNCCNSGEDKFKGVTNEVKQVFMALKDTIKDDYGIGWGICVFSGVRSNNQRSDHYSGHAIDIAITDDKGNATGRKQEMAIVFDILLTCYEKYLRQLIWENGAKGTTVDSYPTNCVHFAVKNSNKTENNFNVFQAVLKNGGYETIRDKNSLSNTFCYCLAKKFNNDNYTNSEIQNSVYNFTSSSQEITNITNPKEFLNGFFTENSK